MSRPWWREENRPRDLGVGPPGLHPDLVDDAVRGTADRRSTGPGRKWPGRLARCAATGKASSNRRRDDRGQLHLVGCGLRPHRERLAVFPVWLARDAQRLGRRHDFAHAAGISLLDCVKIMLRSPAREWRALKAAGILNAGRRSPLLPPCDWRFLPKLGPSLWGGPFFFAGRGPLSSRPLSPGPCDP